MNIKAIPSLNLDLLNLLNIMTGDKLYKEYHRVVQGRFNSILNPAIKGKVSELAKKWETTYLSERVALLITALPGFNGMDLNDLLNSHREISEIIDKEAEEGKPHKFDKAELNAYFWDFRDMVIPFVRELKRVGMVEYWQRHNYPLLNSRSRALGDFLNGQDTGDMENVYLCAFAAPHETKLHGMNIMIDYKLTDEAALAAVKRVVEAV
jgi:hypothetical protein